MTQAAETFSKCQAYKAYAIVTKEPNKVIIHIRPLFCTLQNTSTKRRFKHQIQSFQFLNQIKTKKTKQKKRKHLFIPKLMKSIAPTYKIYPNKIKIGFQTFHRLNGLQQKIIRFIKL